jgi:TrmH family RNA methyltransferase
MESAAQRFAFVLVRPKYAGNVGAAARALKNMGFSDLRLVEAKVGLAGRREARLFAAHAADLLDRAKTYARLDEALVDCALAVGTTCRSGFYRRAARSMRELAAELAAEGSGARTAFIFGPEDHGLSNSDLMHCQQLATIPAAPAYGSLNLAQAVLLTAYELFLAGAQPVEVPAAAARASAAEVSAMLKRLGQALLRIGFLSEDNRKHIMLCLRELFGRSRMTAHELSILNGVASQLLWCADGGFATLRAKAQAGKRLR